MTTHRDPVDLLRPSWSRKSTRGFTLIELMIVIAIIAILAAILIPNFLHARAESTTASCETNLKNIAIALEEYAVDNSGAYPPDLPSLVAAQSGVYLKIIPPDPAGGTYSLTTPATAPCSYTANQTFRLSDGGQHDPTTTLGVPGYSGSTTKIDYCSGEGLKAGN